MDTQQVTNIIIQKNCIMKKIGCLIVLFAALLLQLHAQVIITPPAGNLTTKINKNGVTIIPNGRFVQSFGKQIDVAPHPYGMVISPDGNTLVTANSGTSPLSITIIRNITSPVPQVQQIPEGNATQKGVLASVFMGLAISSDSKIVYVSGGQENKIYLFELATGKSMGVIDCSATDSGIDYTNGYIGDMVLNKAGDKLYALDQIGFRLIVIDIPTGKIVSNTKVGRYPFGIALSPNEQMVYVANVGMYEYKYVEDIDPKNPSAKALAFPPYKYLSSESNKGIITEGVSVPGLGDPQSPEAFSIWAVNISNTTKPVVTAKIKTGFQIGEILEGIPAVGGSSPNSVVANANFVFVSNGNNDCVSVIDVNTNKLVKNIMLNPEPKLKNLRGIIPFGLALSPDGNTLYVAESGINAVAVVDIKSLQVVGHFPTGWFPSKLAVSPNGDKIYVANAKGYGSGPNGGEKFNPGPEGSNIGRLMKGTISLCETPVPNALPGLTKKVIDNNFKIQAVSDPSFASRRNNPIALYPGQKKSPIKYWVFITKENRTFDEVFGQLPYVNGDATLARFGANVPEIENSNKTLSVKNVTVAPNHLALAKKFSVANNFYCDSDHSADGHRWLVGTYPNEWVETTTSASYGGNRNRKATSVAPGSFLMVGSSSAIYPEDYNEAGSMWDHFDRNRISYFNFGMGLGLSSRLDDIKFKPLSVKYLANYPLPGSLLDNSSRLFPVYNTAIPDQFRADMFIKEVEERWRIPNKRLPSVLVARIPNDHGAGERPKDGYPFRESYMADNDLAIGRVIEYLSHTPYWKEMAVVITEDDSQGGVDHVDAHRSILMLVSPYAKKQYAGNVHYSFGSIFKTMWNSLGISYLNQYDAAAADMGDMFTDKPDFTPYNAISADIRIFNPQDALDPLNEKFNWKALEMNSDVDHPSQMIKDSEELDKKLKEQKKNKSIKSKKQLK